MTIQAEFDPLNLRKFLPLSGLKCPTMRMTHYWLLNGLRGITFLVMMQHVELYGFELFEGAFGLFEF